MNYPAASGRGIKEPPHRAIMCAPRGGELNPKEINNYFSSTFFKFDELISICFANIFSNIGIIMLRGYFIGPVWLKFTFV
jgi:hypothetical protein